MSAQDVVARIEASGEIPTIDGVVGEVLRLAADPSADFRAVGAVIERDPSLTARVLRAANSPYYGLRGQVASAERAAGVLGLREVRNIALSVSVIAGFSARFGGETFDWQRFWEHSSGCALIARVLARLLRLPTDGDEYVGGLLHDVGKILFGHHFPEDFGRALELAAAEGRTMEEAEGRVLGTDHGRLGHWVATRWGLPEGIVEGIGHHHHPEQATGRGRVIAATVHLADLLAKAKCIGFGGDDVAVCLEDDPAWAILAEVRPELADLDLERFTFQLDREVAGARDLIREARAP